MSNIYVAGYLRVKFPSEHCVNSLQDLLDVFQAITMWRGQRRRPGQELANCKEKREVMLETVHNTKVGSSWQNNCKQEKEEGGEIF